MTRFFLAAGVAVLLVGSMFTTAATAAPAQPGTTCTARITAYRFHPASVAEGASSMLTLKVKDCTNHAVKVSLTQYGAQPPGCAVLDPVAQPATLRPGHVYVRQQEWTAPDCLGTERITVTVDGPSGKQLAKSTAHLTVTA